MEPGGARNPITQLRRGVLEYCVLALLGDEELYGFDLVRRLSDVDGMVVSEGTIYPLLSRLRRDGWVSTTWVESESGPPRRYYALTAEGRRALTAFAHDWQRFKSAVDHLMPGEQLMTTTTDALVTDYLARLDAAAAALPRDRRLELLEGIGGHIDEARASGAAGDEAGMRTLLDRLGEPEEIVAAAGEDAAYGPPLVARRRGTGMELAAVLMLTVGSVLPVIGWLVGVGLLWASPRWRVREKLVGTLVFPLGPGAAILAAGLLPFSVVTETCTGSADGAVTCVTDGGGGPPGWVAPLVLAVVLIAPIVVAVWLFRTAVRRAEAEPPALVPAYGAPRTSPWGALEVSGVLVLGLGGFLLLFLGPLLLVGPLLGYVLVCCSLRWSLTHKAVAGALAFLPITALAVVAFQGDVALDAPVSAGLAASLLAPAVAAIYLTAVLQRRR